MRCRSIPLALAAAASLASARPALADDAACIAASESALAVRKQGKLRQALGPLALCADPACPAEIKEECAKQIQEIKAALPSLTLIVKDRNGNDLTVVKITMDGAALPGAFDGRPLTLDPGQHTFRFEAVGLAPLEKSFVLHIGEKDRRETVVLQPPPVTSYWSPQRVAGLATAGVGVVGLVVGGVFTGFAASAKSREQSDCAPGACLTYRQGVEDYNTATKNATGATVGFVAGGVLAAAGVVLFLTAPRTAGARAPSTTGALHLSPLVAGGGGGLSIRGSF